MFTSEVRWAGVFVRSGQGFFKRRFRCNEVNDFLGHEFLVNDFLGKK